MNKKDRSYFIKQKLIGAYAIFAGLAPIIVDGDGTFALVAIPVGIYLIFSKKHLIV